MKDRNARRFRIEQLKKNIKRITSYGELFNECIAVLDINSRVYSLEKSQEFAEKMVNEFRFTKWGRVDWNSISHKLFIKNALELNMYNLDLNQNYFIIWNEYNLPVIETTIGDVIKNFEDIVAVGFDTWVINFDEGIIIENYHEGELTIGKKANE
ncbi:CDI toxin immunity protein [Paenibacillus nasutitermitis]|uniref:Uncharacterized protein n=1 Tax=Paenibacillus nasutitermitis TaxID=1652958 RepID=A0A916ZDG1_9BACL|nr:hypothetical protein [Paenibacillus nasutitermitis]GGD89882.1 hypothetical protein GCM10010911_55680 [Paenibacillus nasutitermitis]